MPKLANQDGIETINAGNFQFSAARIERLGAPDYTLATIATDISYSLDGFEKEIEEMLRLAVESCQLSPRKDSLLLRHINFSDNIEEDHGFELLPDIAPDRYNGVIKIKSNTSLNEAVLNAVEATRVRGKQLVEANYGCNGIIFIVTDGMDTTNSATTVQVKNAIKQVRLTESLESLVTIVIGINEQEQMAAQALEVFCKEAGITHFISMQDASKKSLAKLAQFISKSISSTSQALGTGGPSKQVAPGQSLTI